MSDETTTKSGKAWVYVAGMVALVPFLYTLSIGPAIVLRERRVVSDGAVTAIYGPLFWIMMKTETAGWTVPYIRSWLRMTATPDPNYIP